MAVDFSALLKRPSGHGKRPKVLPKGSYPGKVKSYELGDKNQNQTPYVRLHCAIMGWPETVDESDKMQEGMNGELIPIDLSKRQLYADIYYQGKDGSDQTYRLDEFLRSCAMDLGAPYEEILPRLAGADVILDVDQYVNQRTGELGNQVSKIFGVQQ